VKESLYLGIDIGGTSIKLGLIKETGEIIINWEIPTDNTQSALAFSNYIWNSIKSTQSQEDLDEHKIKAIGIGSAGFVNDDTGMIYESVNIGWKNISLGESLSKLSGIPVYVGNDANVAALGELWQGNAKGEDNIITITLGTGVGGGIIVNGKIINGENGVAGEIGHIIVDPQGKTCNCGRRGCLETIASATGIVNEAKQIMKKKSHSQLVSFFEENGTISSKDVFYLAAEGDEGAIEVLEKIGDVLGLAIANLGVIINPGMVLIGGGVSKAGEQLLSVVRKSFNKYALARVKNACEIKIASLGNDAGIMGAAYLAKSKHTEYSL